MTTGGTITFHAGTGPAVEGRTFELARRPRTTPPPPRAPAAPGRNVTVPALLASAGPTPTPAQRRIAALIAAAHPTGRCPGDQCCAEGGLPAAAGTHPAGRGDGRPPTAEAAVWAAAGVEAELRGCPVTVTRALNSGERVVAWVVWPPCADLLAPVTR